MKTMGRIHIVRTFEQPKRPADYILRRKKEATGNDMKKYIHDEAGRIKIHKYELPSHCPLCLSDQRVVNYNVSGKHFRCLECGHTW